MHKLAIVLMFVAIFGLIPSFAASQVYAQPQKSIIKHEQDFNDDTIRVFNELFEDCPAGTVLYKLNGEMVIVCLIDSTFGTVINNIDGSQTIDINVHVDHDNDHKKKSHHNGGGGNHNNNETEGPDGDCLYNASLPKCDPDSDGNCPDDFNLNEDGNCFPDHHETGCPEGTHGVDDDETGQCYKDDEVDCPDGMELSDGNCRYIPEENNEEPPVVITPTEETTTAEEDNTLEMASDDEATTPTVQEEEQPVTEEEDNSEPESVSTDESDSGEEQSEDSSEAEESNN